METKLAEGKSKTICNRLGFDGFIGRCVLIKSTSWPLLRTPPAFGLSLDV